MINVGKPIPHDSAIGHVTGTAAYIDDLPRRADELQADFVGSPAAAGRIESIDLDEARAVPGVVAVLTAADIPGKNRFGPVSADEPILAEGEVLYAGQPVVVVAAETRDALERACGLVRIRVAAGEPILSIERAVALGRFIGPRRRICRGDPQRALAAAPHRLAGVCQTQGQEHLYFESMAAIAYPCEQGQMLVHASTQNPTEIQHVVAAVLGRAAHEVVCVCKRMGGAFGGKETQAAIPAALAALVAQRTGRCARVVYDKEKDMCSTGKRHAFRTEWEIGFDDAGRILAYRAQMYSDGGASTDLSLSIMERAMLHAENAYFIPHVEICGRVCFTNYPSNTAFRGFGGPQGMVGIENAIQEMASYLRSRAADSNGQANRPAAGSHCALDVQLANLYGQDERNVTPYGQTFSRNHLNGLVAQLVTTCRYRERLAAIESNNGTDRLWLRGLALVPVKFGISFTTRFLNQSSALVNVYTDGTVQVSTGGTEMGQGLNTKIRQLVADEFGLPWQQVLLMPTSTEKNPNTPPTAASAGTDLNGAAAVDACRQIKARLAGLAARQFAGARSGRIESVQDVEFADGQVRDLRDRASGIPFGELCAAAWRERVDLSAHGFFATPGLEYDHEAGRGNPFAYFTQGAAAAEVRIDRFTGELSVPRVDLLIDIGRSINPGIDLGQITGGFLQGMGWVTGECLVYDERGELLSRSPTTYKIPAVTDLPETFHCELFANDDNVQNVAASKAVGEPPLMHAIAVWTAVKHALSCVHPAAASMLRLPATGEEILRCLTAAETIEARAAGAPGGKNGRPAASIAAAEPTSGN